MQRLHWKHDLIARVDARVHAAPVALPPAATLHAASPDTLEYARIALSGRYRPASSALVRAATELGTGYWVMTALSLEDGRTVWINRGFVPAGTRLAAVRSATPEGAVRIVGLLRKDEPGGSLLQSNQPAAERWYSRDLGALASTRAVDAEPRWFLDAEGETPPPAAGPATPVPGLTVIHFPDNHLVYALTWSALALMALAGIGLAWRRAIRD